MCREPIGALLWWRVGNEADLRQHAPPKSIGALKALLSVMFDSVAKGCADSNIFRPRQTGAVFNWII